MASSSTWYIGAFGLMQYATKTERTLNYMAGVMYFVYLLVGMVVYMLITGTIGFWASYMFLRKIYGSIKID